MTADNSQVPWTEEQWALVNQTVQEEASRARVAATFLPMHGPLPPHTDFVREEIMEYAAPPGGGPQRIVVRDKTTTTFLTLQVNVYLRGSQIADPDLSSALLIFRRAANVIARLEDAIVFRGCTDAQPAVPKGGISGLPMVWSISNDDDRDGLWDAAAETVTLSGSNGEALVTAVSNAIGELEGKGHYSPFAVVLGPEMFLLAQTPANGLTLPQDRILPFLGGGPLLRTSTLNGAQGLVVALGAAPVELVVASDMSVRFLQVTENPEYVFRVFEKVVLRIRQNTAICGLEVTLPTAAPAPAPTAS